MGRAGEDAVSESAAIVPPPNLFPSNPPFFSSPFFAFLGETCQCLLLPGVTSFQCLQKEILQFSRNGSFHFRCPEQGGEE